MTPLKLLDEYTDTRRTYKQFSKFRTNFLEVSFPFTGKWRAKNHPKVWEIGGILASIGIFDGCGLKEELGVIGFMGRMRSMGSKALELALG